MRLGDHPWTKNDTILSFYYTKFGLDKLGIDETQCAEEYIGTSVGSLRMQRLNVRCVMGYTEEILSCTSSLQRSVYDEFNSMSDYDLRIECFNILDEADKDSNIIRSKIYNGLEVIKDRNNKDKSDLNRKLSITEDELKNLKNMVCPTDLLHIHSEKIKNLIIDVEIIKRGIVEYNIKIEKSNEMKLLKITTSSESELLLIIEFLDKNISDVEWECVNNVWECYFFTNISEEDIQLVVGVFSTDDNLMLSEAD